MPDDAAILKAAFNLPPEDAIKYFEQKGYKVSFDWHEMKREAHTRAFTVAGVTGLDVLVDIRKTVEKAQQTGQSLESFKKELRPLLEKKGWWGKKIIDRPDGTQKEVDLSAPWRLRTIYQTNMQTAYMAGRYKGMKDSARLRPYWQYVAVMDGRTRDAHRLLNGKIFRHDDPFWDKYYPPNGWGCRCRVVSISKYEFEKKGFKTSDGEVEANAIMPFVPDGWDYNPGKTLWQPDPQKYSVDLRPKVAQIIEKAASMDDEDRYAVNTYVSGGSYVLNEKLRTETPLTGAEEKIVKSLDKVIATQPKYKGEVTRSLFFNDNQAVQDYVSQFKPASIFPFKQFLSTTKGDVYNPDGQVQMFIKSLNGADFAEFNPAEQEVLFARNSSFKVKKATSSNDIYYIWLEEVADDE
ncbi:MAG TPA: phage minor head protein [Candidatus Rifleibacterium sp.]|nr:phage minor head protein [Candidatus Rifleibacterium sp.]HPT45045.1 phage minor head protein [Candidatus Rifleibacterium sp.]